MTKAVVVYDMGADGHKELGRAVLRDGRADVSGFSDEMRKSFVERGVFVRFAPGGKAEYATLEDGEAFLQGLLRNAMRTSYVSAEEIEVP